MSSFGTRLKDRAQNFLQRKSGGSNCLGRQGGGLNDQTEALKIILRRRGRAREALHRQFRRIRIAQPHSALPQCSARHFPRSLTPDPHPRPNELEVHSRARRPQRALCAAALGVPLSSAPHAGSAQPRSASPACSSRCHPRPLEAPPPLFPEGAGPAGRGGVTPGPRL